MEGTVTNSVTHAGLAGATVRLEQNGKVAFSTRTDADGRFRFEAVRDGDYSVSYVAAGYGSPRPDALLHVRAGLQIYLEGRMVPMSRVSGRVVDTRGQPVRKALVEISTETFFISAGTDDQGNFQLSVPPDSPTYVLSAAAPIGGKPPAPDPETGQKLGWVRTFYPRAAVRDQAAAIALQPGGNFDGLEIRLLALPVHTVRGVLRNPDGTPAAKVVVDMREEGPHGNAPYDAETAADGAFEIPDVVDGVWQVLAEPQREGRRQKADAWVEVRGHDVEGVDLRLADPFRLMGKVILDGPPGTSAPEPPEVTLIQQHDGHFVAGGVEPPVRPQPDGRFRNDDLYPGTYLVVPGAAPPAYYLDSIRLGDQAIAGETELSNGSELTIVYKSDGGSVRGTVAECAGGRAVLVAVNGPRWTTFSAECDAHGRFHIDAVRPGEYYAVGLGGDGIWSGNVDTAFVQAASRVSVRAREAAAVELTVYRLH